MGRIFLSPPSIGRREYELVREAFDSNYVAPLGPMLDRFEADLSAYTGFAAAAGLASGTAAIHLALRILGVQAGDVVVVPSLTFIGSVAPITYIGAEPVFIDVEVHSWLLDPGILDDVLGKLTREGRRAKAVIAVDLYGQPCDVQQLLEITGRHGAELIVDAAESLGSRLRGVHAGKGAPIACLSMNGNKIITTSGGGALLSDRADVVARARYLSQQAREPMPHYEHVEVGYNYRLSNICAAIGVAQLETIEQRVAARRAVFEAYERHLAGEGAQFMPEVEGARANRWLTVMTLDESLPMTPETLRKALDVLDIEARPVWKPMHLQPVFRRARMFGGKVSEHLFARGICLPSGAQVDEACVQRVADAFVNLRGEHVGRALSA